MNKPSFTEVRNFCIEEQLFTAGSCNQYEKMFAMLDSDEFNLRDIALVIWICSETELSVDDIYDRLLDMASYNN